MHEEDASPQGNDTDAVAGGGRNGTPMAFIISSPRSGSTMLERILEAHSAILGGPEPHLLTPLAHLGVWANVEKAPYDHVLAAEAQRAFVERLPGGEADYWAACRAYCDALYGRLLEASGKRIMLDKTPAYALILPFLAHVFPDARYIVLSRHPAATLASYANSFFDGDYAAAYAYNPILRRYAPAMAAFLRRRDVAALHVRYEDLVMAPEAWVKRIHAYLCVPHEPETIDYGASGGGEAASRGGAGSLGDPIGVGAHRRPSTASLHKWAAEVREDTRKRAFLEKVIAELDPADLAELGYPVETLWAPLTEGADAPVRPPGRRRWTRYRLQRRMIVGLRGMTQKTPALQRLLRTVRLGCDVLLRE